MELNNASSLRQMLEQLPSEVLQEMLDQELQNKTVNGDTVRLILELLRSRTPAAPAEPIPEGWENYQELVTQQDRQRLRKKRCRKFLIRALPTAAILVLILTTVLPQQVEAENIWKRLTRWTEDVVEFFTPNDNEHRLVEYEFKTDNPGLQEVYDAVVEMGVTEPVVPMWLPEGSTLLECKPVTSRSRSRLSSRFSYSETEINFVVDKYDVNVSREFQKDSSEVTQYEVQGTTFLIMRNNKVWSVIWYQDNIECSLFIDCQEDILYGILNSVYDPEA